MKKSSLNDEKAKVKSTRVVLPIGSSSLIVVFIVLCMAIFTAITYVTAANEKKLTGQSSEFLKKYYLANEEASRVLSDLQTKLDAGTDTMSLYSDDGYVLNLTSYSVEFDVPIDDNLVIRAVAINENGRLMIDELKMFNLNSEMVFEDEFLNLYGGDEGFEGFADDFEDGSGG